MRVTTFDPQAGRTFNEVINQGATIVDFYADWCGPCRAMAPTLDKFAASRDDVSVVKVNIDKHPELASEYGVRSIPTLLGFAGGVETGRSVGVTNGDGLAALLA